MSGSKKHSTSKIIFLLLAFSMLISPAASAYDSEFHPSLPSKMKSTVHFSRLTSQDGLSQNSVKSILQDKRGMIWIGTKDGLNRFDGYNFTIFKHNVDDPTSLTRNEINDIYEDTDGKLWIATNGGGVDSFDPDTQKFTHYRFDPDNPNSLAGNIIFTIFQDSKKNMWFGGPPNCGLSRLDPATGIFTHYMPEKEPSGWKGIWQIIEDTSSNLWFAGEKSILKYNITTDEFTSYGPVEFEKRLSTLAMDEKGDIWVGGITGLYKLDQQTGRFQHFSPGPQKKFFFRKIFRDSNGKFWIGTKDTGLYLFDPASESFTGHYISNPLSLQSLSNDTVHTIYEDESGLLWLGTDQGVDQLDPDQNFFADYHQYNSGSKEILFENLSTLTGDPDGDIWFTQKDTLYRYQPDSGNLESHKILSNTLSKIFDAIYCDNSGTIWLGIGSEVIRFDKNTKKYKTYSILAGDRAKESSVSLTEMKPPPGAFDSQGPPPVVSAFYRDKDGILWIAVAHRSIFSFDPIEESFQPYPNNTSMPEDSSIPVEEWPTEIYGSSSGKLWIGYANRGFSCFDIKSKTFTNFFYNPKNSKSFPDIRVKQIYETTTGIIWVASSEGLVRFDPEKESNTIFTEQDGLPTSYIVGLLEDDSGNLWLSTKKGLSRFNPEKKTFKNYDLTHGLHENEFIRKASWRSDDGRLYFAGSKGFIAFYPEDIKDSLYQPSVILTELQIFNKEIKPGESSVLHYPIWKTEHLTLNHDQGMISLAFAAMNFSAPLKTRYRYMLEGFDSNWNEVDANRRFATYTNLPAGKYIFHVQATNHSGIWSKHEARLSILALPPFWATLWFKGISLALLLVLLIGAYSWRVRGIKKRNLLLEDMVASRTKKLEIEINERKSAEKGLQQAKTEVEKALYAAEGANKAKSDFLANMSHELRTPLNAILGFSQLMMRNPDISFEQLRNLETINRSGEHLLSLINDVLELSKIEAGRLVLSKENFDLHKLLLGLEEMFELRARQKGLSLQFERTNDVPQFIHTDQNKLRQILINLLGNAVKFTNKGGIILRVTNKNPGQTQNRSYLLTFDITDTGIGIPREEHNKIFDAFFQTDEGKSSQQGTGLGLPISRKFVELMGGSLTVTSEIGKGTSFVFNLQVDRADHDDLEESRKAPLITGIKEGQPDFKILVVEDNEYNRKLLITLLTTVGFNVKDAENGRKALEVWQEWQPDLIWMDMRMPVMNGYEATQRIKNAPGGKDTIIIALTASAFEEDRIKVIEAGCTDFVRKPFRDSDIFEILEKHLGVQFIYNEAREHIPLHKIATKKISEKDLFTAINTLPEELITKIIDAAELSDTAMIDNVVEEIHAENTELAATILDLADNYKYDKILLIIKNAKNISN